MEQLQKLFKNLDLLIKERDELMRTCPEVWTILIKKSGIYVGRHKTDLHNIQKSLDEAKELLPSAENLGEIEPDENISKEDLRFLKRCCQILRKLGYIKTQYEFSEQFLGKNRYYFGMILCEGRHPSIDAIHNLVRNLSQINDGLHKLRYLDDLYEQGQAMITKRLLKYL